VGTVQLPTFGHLLRRHRQVAGMTQEELAERAGMSARGISDLERGLRLPRRDTLQLLLDALQVSPEERSRLQTAARTRTSAGAVSEPPLEQGRFLGSLPPGRLVGRQREVARLLAALEVVAHGGGRLVMLTGEPGIGKTRVAQESAMEAVKRGFLVATGRCYETEQDVPFHPFVEALAGLYPALPPDARAAIPDRWPYLAALLPDELDQSAAASAARVAGLEGQQRLFRAVSGLLGAIAEETPVALLLDDLHWADDASLKLLLHLVRQTRRSRVLLLGTYRDVEVDARHPLDRALVDLNRERLVERVVLHHLDLDGTSALIAETLDGEIADLPELAAMVQEVTSGNPFFAQEVLHMLIGHGDLYAADGRWYRRDIQEIPPPETVRSAIQQRLSRLPPPAESVLREASVLGQVFSFDELQGLAGRAEEEIDVALEAAVAMGLVREAGQSLYAFNHVLTHQTLYADLSQRRRQRLHLAAGDALAELPEPVRTRRAAEIARHFRAGGNAEQAVRYSLLAGDRAEALFAYEDAQRHFRTAVELTSGSAWEIADPSLRARALARLGRVLDIAEKYDEALEILEQAADIFRAQGSRESEVATVAEIGWIHHNRRTDEQGTERLRPLVTALSAEPASDQRDRLLAILHTALARLFFGLRRYDDELAAAECAAEAAGQLGDDTVLAVAEARRGAALMSLGRPEDARNALDRAIALAETTGNLGTMSVALGNLGEIACDGGDYHRSRHELERAVEVAEQTGLPGRMGWTLVKLGRILLLMGELRQARAVLERAAQLLDDDDRAALYPAFYLAQLDARTGTGGNAIGEIEEVIGAAARLHDRWLHRYGSRMLAEIDLLGGDPESARNRLTPLLQEQGKDEPQAVTIYGPLAWAQTALDREDEAEQTLDEGLRRAQAHGHRVAEADLLRVRGMLRSRQERWEEAGRSLQQAIDLAQAMPDPYRLALTHAELSRLYGRMGDQEAARDQEREALKIVERLGSRRLRQYVEGARGERSAEPRTRP
jgi:tetratricopeptide (TPR) repeat protein/transcriptional regulator with XRE-family HTH domain